MILFYTLLFSHIIFFLISVYNYFFAFRFSKHINNINDTNLAEPLISILIPARNEESNIKRCIESVLNQTYTNKEIIVIDDDSNDNTLKILKEIQKANPELKIIKNRFLPANWSGKCHACHLLSKEANGEYLLFLDADVWLDSEAVAAAIHYFQNNNIDLLSVFSTQRFSGFGDQLVVTLLNWFLLGFLPLNLVYKTQISAFSAASGQFMMFKKDSYQRVGGHCAIRNSIVDDMDMARLFKSEGLKVMALIDNGLVEVKMYNSFVESINGFTKNFYAGSKLPPFLFLLLIFIIYLLFVFPFVMIIFDYAYLLIILLILANRFVIAKLSQSNVLFAMVFHIVQMHIFLFIGLNSIARTLTHSIHWKGRVYG